MKRQCSGKREFARNILRQRLSCDHKDEKNWGNWLISANAARLRLGRVGRKIVKFQLRITFFFGFCVPNVVLSWNKSPNYQEYWLHPTIFHWTEVLRWPNTAYDTCTAFAIFQKLLHDPCVAKFYQTTVKRIDYHILIVKVACVSLPL